MNVFLSVADQISKKWLATDKLSYYGILSAVCSDLTTYNFGINNFCKQHDKFISGIIINNLVDPNDITDAVERKKYVNAIARYQNNTRLAQEQSDLHRVNEMFLPLAAENLIAEYSAAPYNTDELKNSLNKSLVAPDVREEILTAVKENIQHNAAAGK